MKVSIIIPVYNVEKYIVRCLDSVKNQTYQDIECILVDDCGQDNSIIIIEDYIKKYEGNIQFKITHHKTNKGLSAARNTGIKESSGDLLYFLDSDDAIVENAIETLMSLFKKHPNIQFAQGNILNERGEISNYGFQREMPEYTSSKQELYKIMLSEITTVAWNRLIRKDFVIEHNLFFPEGYFTEDMYWGYFIANYAQAASFSNSGLYIYYINDNSMMTSPKRSMRMKWYTSRLWTSNVYLLDIINTPSNKYKRQYLAANLLSCIVELKAIKSTKQWFIFWYNICNIAIKHSKYISLYRCLLFLCLLPPLCFIISSDKIRWRIQKSIISHV